MGRLEDGSICGTLQFVLGFVFVDWAVALWKSDRDLLSSWHISSE